MIPFIEENSKNGLREAVDQVLYCQYQRPVLSSTRKWRRRYMWKCTFMGSSQKFKWSVTLTLTLDRAKVTSTYTVHVGPTTCRPNHVTVASPSTEICGHLNSSDTFPRRKFEKWPPRSCRPGPILSISTVSFELHAKVGRRYTWKCTFMGNCRKCK